ncbi:MAG TPA: ATP-binding protein [Tepidisphaeraceae bacterium]|nr:ATP-binding protein [Tepidisphaeraceae bacterium]
MASSPLVPNQIAPESRQDAEALLGRIAQAGHAIGPAIWPQLPKPVPVDGRYTLVERRYRALVEHIPVVTFLASLEHEAQELYVSPQIEELLGYTQKEWLEDPFLWYNRLHPDDRQRWAEEFARTCATGTRFRSEYRFIARNDRTVWVHGECQVIRDDQGVPLFLQGIAYDITESKEAQELLRRTGQELEQRVQARTAELRQEVQRSQELADQLAEEGRRKDEFLAVLAHELRNPLAPVPPALHLLRQEQTDPDNRRWAIDMIDRQVSQMSRLIDDLLDVSRISRGKIALHVSVVDLRDVMERAVDVVRPALEVRRHRLVVHPAAEPAWVRGDAVRLEQIASNLLTNAVKYTEPGGLIEVQVGRQETDAILRVRDNGIGIPPEMLERIFEMFAQVNTSAARPAQWGLGIGLALVRGLVQLHGGTVTALSEGPGQGSEFIIRLPLVVQASGGPAAGPSGQKAKPLPCWRILLVEDNADAARALSLLLRAWGQDVSTVHDGASALAALAANPPELIFMDIGLPGMDGYDLARRIRTEPGGDRLILVALTGYGRPEDRQRALDAGFDFHLTKPIGAEVLRHLLRPDGELFARKSLGNPRS